MESVYAGQLQPGDQLLKIRAKDEGLVGEEVMAMKRKLESSYWAPLTKEAELRNVNFYTEQIFPTKFYRKKNA